MKRFVLASLLMALMAFSVTAEVKYQKLDKHPDTAGWQDLFAPDLSNAEKPEGVWSVADGVLTADQDKCIWTAKDYENFVVDLEFKTADGTNSGVFVYQSDSVNWTPKSIEIQIADDFSPKWSSKPKTWQCGAVFGHLPASKSVVKHPGEWNRMTIQCIGTKIDGVLNGEPIFSMDMKDWKSAKTNPDGSEIPPWKSVPLSELPAKGKIGLQGKHGDAPIWFRNLKVKELQ